MTQKKTETVTGGDILFALQDNRQVIMPIIWLIYYDLFIYLDSLTPSKTFHGRVMSQLFVLCHIWG